MIKWNFTFFAQSTELMVEKADLRKLKSFLVYIIDILCIHLIVLHGVCVQCLNCDPDQQFKILLIIRVPVVSRYGGFASLFGGFTVKVIGEFTVKFHYFKFKVTQNIYGWILII